MIAFGPVPSRRLGRSLGINNIPPKVCTFSCTYCQLGRTNRMQVERRRFYAPEEISRQVQDKVATAKEAGESINYLTFVPDGEPTLDIHLGSAIELLRPLDIRIAVITNASLLWRLDVREDLMKADWVSLKIDATRTGIWQEIDRPHRALRLDSILNGMLEFADAYERELTTETMLVGGLNDGDGPIRDVARFVARLRPATAYLVIPTRPPAEKWVHPPSETDINRAFQIFSQYVDHVEYLIAYEGNAFTFIGNVKEDLLSITAVHPMREDAVGEFLRRAGVDWSVVRTLIAQGQLVEMEHEGRKFYMRKLPSGHAV